MNNLRKKEKITNTSEHKSVYFYTAFLEYSDLRTFVAEERKSPSKHSYTFLPSITLRSINQPWCNFSQL